MSRRRGKVSYIQGRHKGHPKGGKDGKVNQHILIAEKALGRFMPDKAEVHHVNGDKSDNSRGNLVICENKEYHCSLHRRADSLVNLGRTDGYPCVFCSIWGLGDTMYVSADGKRAYHRSCNNEYQRDRKIKIKNFSVPLTNVTS